jgi:pimeloyl-ACP methyl ester carboxylesterase
MPQVQLNDITLHYIDEGPGEAILFLHGLGSCGDDWILQTQVFAQHYRVIAPDVRGHGRSTKARGPYSIQRMSDDVVALLDALSIDAAFVVGLSLGGMLALQLGIHHPQRVRRLVLTNTCACLLDGGPRFLISLARRALISLALPLERSARHVANGLFPYEDQSEIRRLAIDRLAQNDRQAYRATIKAIRRFDVRRQLQNINAPTLVVSGDRDRTIPLALQRKLVRHIPQARWEVVRDSGHATPLDQPDRYNTLLQSFIHADRLETAA